MPEINQGAQENSPSPLADAIASSPEAQEQIEQQTQDTQAGTAQQPEGQEQIPQQVQEEVPAHLVPRFKEVVDEKNWYKQQLEKMLQERQSQQQFQQPTTNPYAGMTAEEEKFFRMMDARAEKIAEQKVRQISPVIDAGRMELAQLKVAQFRAMHPDIKPNSSEEIAIAEKIQMGYLPEDAYRTIMWDRKVVEAEKQAKQSVKQQIENKKQANVENRSISSNSPLPTVQKKLSLRERIAQNYEKMERGEI